MRRVHGVILLPLLLLAAGCPTKAKPDVGANDQSDGSTKSDGSMDTASSIPTLQITSPADGSYTNGTVTITVVASGGPVPATIALMDGNNPIATIGPSQHTYAWNTTGVVEGAHTIVAQAMAGTQPIVSAPVTINIDRTAPRVMSTTPATGAVNVVLRAPITLTFSEAIAASSVTPSSVVLTIGGAAVASTTTLSTDGKAATIAIDDLTTFVLPSTFSVTLASTITDLAGNGLNIAAAAWSWIVPDWIKLAPLSTYSAPVLAVGPDFHPAIIYTQCVFGSNGCMSKLHVAVNDGQSWNDLGQPAPSAEGFGSSMVIDQNSHPIVSWPGMDGTNPAVFVATWTGSAWDTSLAPLHAPFVSGSAIDATTMRLDGSGQLVIAYRENTPSFSDVFVARWTGSTWDISFGELGLTSVSNFDLAINDQDNPVVGIVGSTVGLEVWTGTAWSPGASIGATTPFVTLDSSDYPSMVQVQQSGWHVEHLTNGTWLPAISTPIPVSTMSDSPRLAATRDRRPVVGWHDSSLPPGRIGIARWTGSAWDLRAGLVNGGSSPAGQPPSVVVDARDSIWIGWFENLEAFVWMSNY